MWLLRTITNVVIVTVLNSHNRGYYDCYKQLEICYNRQSYIVIVTVLNSHNRGFYDCLCNCFWLSQIIFFLKIYNLKNKNPKFLTCNPINIHNKSQPGFSSTKIRCNIFENQSNYIKKGTHILPSRFDHKMHPK